MLVVAAVLFALAALGGIILATLHLKKNDAPVSLALVHGVFDNWGGSSQGRLFEYFLINSCHLRPITNDPLG